MRSKCKRVTNVKAIQYFIVHFDAHRCCNQFVLVKYPKQQIVALKKLEHCIKIFERHCNWISFAFSAFYNERISLLQMIQCYFLQAKVKGFCLTQPSVFYAYSNSLTFLLPESPA